MKKLLALALSLVFILSLAGCGTGTGTPEGTPGTENSPGAESPGTESPGGESPGVEPTTAPPEAGTKENPVKLTAPTPKGIVKADATKDTLTVGTPEMNGDFIWGFGNNSYDKYVKDLITGVYYYPLVTWDTGANFFVNPVVVKEYYSELDDAGNKTFVYTLHDDLKWSNGEQIVAKDYVAQLLFYAHPEWTKAGATQASDGDLVMGYEAYHGDVDDDGNEIAPSSDTFAGVKLLGELQLSITAKAEELPYFYELTMASAYPIYREAFIPGGDIESGDAGAKITGVDMAACAEQAASENGERRKPTVSCGPYTFVSFQNQICTLKRNPNFKSDYQGGVPQFENVVVKNVNQETDVDSVIAGEIDISTGVIEGTKIEAAKASDSAVAYSYLRNGYGLLGMHCDWGPTADPNVRWALGSLIDRQEVIDYVLGGYGGTVDGPYGLASWMYQERKSELSEALSPIAFNIQKANEFLDQSEWKFEADGSTPYDASKAVADGSYMRHNANKEMLTVNHAGTDENAVTNIIEIQYLANAPLAGVNFVVTKTDFDTLLDCYYHGQQKEETGERFYNTFNLATGFAAAYDPYYSYHSDHVGTENNPLNLADTELDGYINKMRRLESDETELFADIFVEYVTRWNDLLPEIPLYSNEYFDIYNTSIEGLASTPFVSWAETICSINPTK